MRRANRDEDGSRLPSLRERDIQLACTQLLELDGWRPVRTDPQSERGFIQRCRQRLKQHGQGLEVYLDLILKAIGGIRGAGFGEKGMADHLYIRYEREGPAIPNEQPYDKSWAQVLWVEFKRPGEKTKAHQDTWHRDERLRGALTLKAGEDFEPTVDGFLTWYRKSGLMRRPI